MVWRLMSDVKKDSEFDRPFGTVQNSVVQLDKVKDPKSKRL